MQYVGFFLVVVAIVGVIYGVLQQLKAKKILAAPFKKTAEVAANPQAGDAQGLISCEGAVQVQQPGIAPCSGKACLYYEVEIERVWEKTVQTENGLKTEKGKDTVSTKKEGIYFWLNDGSGPVGVDARADVDVDLEKSFEQMQNVSYGDIMFGNFHASVPHVGGDKRTVGIRATEKILPAQGNLFVVGKLAGGSIMKTDGMLGKLLASTKGRDKLIGATKRNSLLGFVAGGVMLLPGGYFSIFGEPPVDNCANMADAIATMCTGRITDDFGNTYDWTVTKPGTYKVEVLQPDVKIPILPSLSVKDSTGKELTRGEDGEAELTHQFAAGTYKINVRDSMKGDAEQFQGGFSFSLNTKLLSESAPAASASGAAPVASGAKPAAAKPAGAKPAAPKAAAAKPAGSGW